MSDSEFSGPFARRLGELDLTAEVNDIFHVEATVIEAAGKVRYKTRKKGGGITRKHVERTPEHAQRDGKRRAIRSMQEIAHAEKLTHFVTLTFAQQVDEKTATKAWTKAARSRSIKPIGPYIYALEYGSEGGNLHIHALTRKDTAERLKQHWPHGYSDIKPILWEEIDAVCAYIGKCFSDPERPGGARYRASRGSRPPRQKLILPDEAALYAVAIEASRGRDVHSTWSLDTGLGRFGQLAWNPSDDR